MKSFLRMRRPADDYVTQLLFDFGLFFSSPLYSDDLTPSFPAFENDLIRVGWVESQNCGVMEFWLCKFPHSLVGVFLIVVLKEKKKDKNKIRLRFKHESHRLEQGRRTILKEFLLLFSLYSCKSIQNVSFKKTIVETSAKKSTLTFKKENKFNKIKIKTNLI